MSGITAMISFCEGADPELGLPAQATRGAAGLDIRANFHEDIRADGLTLGPGEYKTIPSGIRIALPEGFEAQIRPRSGLAAKHGVTILNAPGTIDSDYRGEIGVVLINHGDQAFHVRHGDRIAQMVISLVIAVQWDLAEMGDSTNGRGHNGFGSTGRS